MTAQEIFDKVYTHLLVQRYPSMSDPGDEADAGRAICMYRGVSGRSCAVGCLISDDAYLPMLENLIATNIHVVTALENSGIEVTEGIEHMLNELQAVHDGLSQSAIGFTEATIGSQMRNIAEKYSLAYRVLQP